MRFIPTVRRSRKSVVESLLATALLGLLACSDRTLTSRALEPTPAKVPEVAATVIGPKQVVFDTRSGCELVDIPDAPARAFRDDRGLTHLIASHWVARAQIGPDLDHLRRDCHVIYRSPKDPDPSHFQYNNWLYSFYTEDGRRIAALVHSEFDADEIPGLCATPKDSNNCWWNTVTFAESLDGGFSFKPPVPPSNLIAAVPYRYVVGNRDSAYGYTEPSNIVKVGGLYYALINNWPYKDQKYGPCLIRTSDLHDPGSWRAWDGTDFVILFANPYRASVAKPAEHVCEPVYPGSADTLVQHAGTGNFISTQLATDDRFRGPPGFYIESSRDLTHWSKPSLLVSFSDLRTADGPGKWTYGYDSLIDPSSADRNFSTVSDEPYFYYVRMDGDHPPYSRVLFRRKIRLQFGQ